MNWKDIYDDFKYKNPLVAIVHRPQRCNGYDLIGMICSFLMVCSFLKYILHGVETINTGFQ